MADIDLHKLKYPIGDFVAKSHYDADERNSNILTIEMLPSKLETAITGLNNEQLNTAYRPEGWTVRQVVHHLADSHMNSFVRFKWALTEDTPEIKPYLQAKWCDMADAKNLDVKPSLQILTGVHARLTAVLTNMNDSDFARTLYHPEMKKNLSLSRMLALYAWHSKHHLRQVTDLKLRMNW